MEKKDGMQVVSRDMQPGDGVLEEMGKPCPGICSGTLGRRNPI